MRRAVPTPPECCVRWESLSELVNATVEEPLRRLSPLPDTGSHAGDERAHAAGIAADLSGPDGTLLLRAATRTPHHPPPVLADTFLTAIGADQSTEP